jgi:hypothetical protein
MKNWLLAIFSLDLQSLELREREPMPVSRPQASAIAMVLATFLASCSGGSPPGQVWHKPGASDQTVAKDQAECRQSARDEALRQYPYRGAPSAGPAGAVLAQQGDENSRSIVEASIFNICMQSRAYSRG